MDKTKPKKLKKFTYDQRIIEAIEAKYGVTKNYIRRCLNGTVNSLTADRIKADYKDLKKQFDATLQQFNQRL